MVLREKADRVITVYDGRFFNAALVRPVVILETHYMRASESDSCLPMLLTPAHQMSKCVLTLVVAVTSVASV
jgi:hypothetical protein